MSVRRKLASAETMAAIQRVLAGDVDSYNELYKVCDRPLRAFVGRRYHWAGPDFVDEVAVRTHEYALKRLGRFDPAKSSFLTWLCWQARSVAARVQAERFGARFVPLREKHEQWARTEPGPEKLYAQRWYSGELWRAFDALPEECRLAIGLHDLMEHTFEETAELMGVSVGKARRVRERGLSVLRRRMQELGVSPVEVDSTPQPIWYGRDDTGYDDDWTATVTARLPDGPDTLVGADAKDEREEVEPTG